MKTTFASKFIMFQKTMDIRIPSIFVMKGKKIQSYKEPY
jgi:hypothetical protein